MLKNYKLITSKLQHRNFLIFGLALASNSLAKCAESLCHCNEIHAMTCKNEKCSRKKYLIDKKKLEMNRQFMNDFRFNIQKSVNLLHQIKDVDEKHIELSEKILDLCEKANNEYYFNLYKQKE